MGDNSKKNNKCHNQDKTRTSLLHLFRTYEKGTKQEAEKGTVSSNRKWAWIKKVGRTLGALSEKTYEHCPRV